MIRDPSSLTRASRTAGSGVSGLFSRAIDYAITELGPMFTRIIEALGVAVKNLNVKLREMFDPSKGGIKGFLKRLLSPDNASGEAKSAFGQLFDNLKGPMVELFHQLMDTGRILLPHILHGIFEFVKPALIAGTLRSLFTIALRNIPWGTVFRGIAEFSKGFSFATGAAYALLAAVIALTAGFMINSKKTGDNQD